MSVITEQASSKAINAKIKLVKTTGARFNDLVQTAMVMIVEHAMAYGDCTGAARLVDAMPKSNRRSLVIDHFADYSPINVHKTKEGNMNATLRKPESKEYKDWNLDGLKANRWDERPEVEKEPDILTFESARESIFKLFASLEKKAEKSNDETHIKSFLRRLRVASVTNDDEGLAAPEAVAA